MDKEGYRALFDQVFTPNNWNPSNHPLNVYVLKKYNHRGKCESYIHKKNMNYREHFGRQHKPPGFQKRLE